MAATATSQFRPRVSQRAAGEDRSTFLARWLKVWVSLIAIVVAVVVVYLIFITNSLASINSNLKVANTAVTGAGGHTKTLPNQVQGINGSLAGIDPALKPIPGQANQIISNLTSIESKLKTIDPSLQDTESVLSGTSNTLGGIASTLNGTSGTLVGISGSLVDTSSVLKNVLGLAGNIEGTLVAADQPAGNCNAPENLSTFQPPPRGVPGSFSCAANQNGVHNIHQRVSIADNVLAPAQNDLTNIIGTLNPVDQHLTNICRSAAIQTLGAVAGGLSC